MVGLHTWTVFTGRPLLLLVPRLVLGCLFRTLHVGVLVDGWLAIPFMVVAELAPASSLSEDKAAADLHVAEIVADLSSASCELASRELASREIPMGCKIGCTSSLRKRCDDSSRDASG